MGYIEKCIDSVSFADEIIVVDSYSTDGTYEYLLEHPKVTVVQNPFENFTAQKSYTLKQASNDWVLFLDADEVVTESLQHEIVETINRPDAKEAYFTDRKIVHETLVVDGQSGILQEKLIHFCYKNYEVYKGKMLKYGRLKAKEDFYKERHFNYLLMTVKPIWKFFNHYILRLGILDGKKGWTICYLNAIGVLERFRELKRLEKKNELAYYLVMP